MAHEFLERNGVAVNPDTIEHLSIMVEALVVYDSREQSYSGVWRQYGALSNLLSAARKVDRLMSVWWREGGVVPVLHKDNLDDVIDAINYSVFMIRNARQGNILGFTPERPSGPVPERLSGGDFHDGRV